MKKLAIILSTCVILVGCTTVALQEKFSATDAAYIHKQGKATISGQAFMRQRGGGVVTAAGEEVWLLPATTYTLARFNAVYGAAKQTYFGRNIENTPPEYEAYSRRTKADAEGRFTFANVAPGNYIIQTSVFWNVPGSYLREGGSIYEAVTVSNTETQSVILNGS